MKVKIHGKDLVLSNLTESKIEDRLKFLEKYLIINEDDKMNCSVSKHSDNDIKVELSIFTKIGLLRSEVVANDLDTALDKAIDKVERQLLNQKDRLSRRHKEGLSKAFSNSLEQAQQEEKVIRNKWIVAEKMSVDEAILQLEMTDHSFFIFTDIDTDKINVVYKRVKEGYGLIEVNHG